MPAAVAGRDSTASTGLQEAPPCGDWSSNPHPRRRELQKPQRDRAGPRPWGLGPRAASLCSHWLLLTAEGGLESAQQSL